MEVFWQYIGMAWEHLFFCEIHFSGRGVFIGLTFFWPNMGMRIEGFSQKIEKNDDKAMLFREWTLFWQNMGMRGDIFSCKIGKKGASFGLFWPILKCSFNRSYPFFLTKYGHDSRGFVMQNLKKMTLEHRVFERMDIILIKYGHDNREFFRERTFC